LLTEKKQGKKPRHAQSVVLAESEKEPILPPEKNQHPSLQPQSWFQKGKSKRPNATQPTGELQENAEGGPRGNKEATLVEGQTHTKRRGAGQRKAGRTKRGKDNISSKWESIRNVLLAR